MRNFTDLTQRHTQLSERVQRAAAAAQRAADEIKLIAVSKTHPAEAVRAAYGLGLRDFGENYLQEAEQKIESLTELAGIRWHYIGRLQSNKTRLVAERFDWVHTVDRLKVAERLSAQREGDPLNVCLQINIDDDPNKGGLTPGDPAHLSELVSAIEALPGLKLRGLMTILSQNSEPLASFQTLSRLFDGLPQTPDWDTRSMGMSGDLEAAIAAGATHIRIGSALFGPRQTKTTD